MKRIGVDAGGSLIKLAYEEAGTIHVKTYTYEEKDRLMKWLHMLTPMTTIYGTGGRWKELQKSVQHSIQVVDEFAAIVRGTNYLLEKEMRLFEEYILVSMGTGTSIFYVHGPSFERVLGSGIGGGTWMGLGSLLANRTSFQELVALSEEGNRKNSDLLVKDIYSLQDFPLSGELTAANFGKAHLPGEKSESDHLQALSQLIGEVVISLASTVAVARNVKDIVFIGHTLDGNKPLQDVLASFQHTIPYEPLFLDKGAYAGAIGAILS